MNGQRIFFVFKKAADVKFVSDEHIFACSNKLAVDEIFHKTIYAFEDEKYVFAFFGGCKRALIPPICNLRIFLFL